ncbi:hypothetical protein M0812_27145 [Anaeramoeba flamelloides]|uniref:Uncharacterized protein n=1 Tax=Anaeramoeba flamelloides TaxID=1746091 RepID=A0AAV7YD03_9EUKA|nr:hypothetical protein M0812_27145 [Anaeramoeba flamelloides]
MFNLLESNFDERGKNIGKRVQKFILIPGGADLWKTRLGYEFLSYCKEESEKYPFENYNNKSQKKKSTHKNGIDTILKIFILNLKEFTIILFSIITRQQQQQEYNTNNNIIKISNNNINNNKIIMSSFEVNLSRSLYFKKSKTPNPIS